MESGTFCWYELATDDPEAAKKFYGDLFGWTFEDHPMPGDHPGTYTMVRLGGKDLGGLYRLEGKMWEGVPPHWGSYVAAEDVDTTAARAREFGGELIYEPMDVPNVGRMVAFRGPEGAVISAYKAAAEPPDDPVDKTQEGAFCWSELLSSDVKKSLDFYSKVFNWSTETMAAGMHYTVFKAGEAMTGGLMEKPEQMGDAPSAWGHYIAVTDCDAKAKQALGLGATILVPPSDIPNMGRFCTFQDPQGAVISIWQPAHQG